MDSTDVPEVSIVMPCLNEAEGIAHCVDQAMAFLKRTGLRGEVVIGDGGSTDGSVEIATEHGARVVDIPIRGYGAGLFGATSAARGRYIIIGDSDGSHDLAHLDLYIEKLRQGYEFVVGDRYGGSFDPKSSSWVNRLIGNPLLSGVGRVFFHVPVRDFNCGLRGFTREAFDRMGLVTTGMEYASEMIIKAALLKMKIAEVPVAVFPPLRSRPPHLRRLRDGWRTLQFMLLYSPRWLFLYPGLFLAILGLLVCAVLMRGEIVIRGTELSVHTMFYAAIAVVIGFQAVVFALFSKVYAEQEGLLPPDIRLKPVTTGRGAQYGILLGVILFLGGLATAVYGLKFWGALAEGRVNIRQSLRLVIPAGLAMALGFETATASFFLNLLRMGRVQRDSASVRKS